MNSLDKYRKLLLLAIAFLIGVGFSQGMIGRTEGKDEKNIEENNQKSFENLNPESDEDIDDGRLLRAYPKSPLIVEKSIKTHIGQRPTSIGVDGNIYGASWEEKGDGELYRAWYSEDQCETSIFTEEVFDQAPVFVTKTDEKYIVITKKHIYQSDDFDSGYKIVFSAQEDDVFHLMGVHYYHGRSDMEQSIIIVGEYGHLPNPPEARRLFASFNGGYDWKQINECQVVDNDVNAHWHSSAYDPYRGRIWASQGDGIDNGILSYSDDLGENWTIVDVPENPYIEAHQPTALAITPRKILTCPDGGPIPSSMLSIPVDNKSSDIKSEIFPIKYEHLVWSQIKSYQGYAEGTPVYADDGSIYIYYGSQYGFNKWFILATGDGGETFHNVYVVNGQGEDLALGHIVGQCKDGYMYSFSARGKKTGILKFKPIEWIYN